MTNQTGELIVQGMNFRSYNVEKKTWVMRWLNATGFWLELGPEKLGGVRVAPKTITFNFTDTFAPDALTRITFSNISESHFTWIGERSLDQRKTWAEFMVIQAHRTNDVSHDPRYPALMNQTTSSDLKVRKVDPVSAPTLSGLQA